MNLKNISNIIIGIIAMPIMLPVFILDEIFHIPSNIKKYNEKRHFMMNSQTYIELKDYRRYCDYNFFEDNKYKQYIHFINSETKCMEKAYLMINKNTHEFAYVSNGIIIENDVERYNYTNEHHTN